MTISTVHECIPGFLSMVPSGVSQNPILACCEMESESVTVSRSSIEPLTLRWLPVNEPLLTDSLLCNTLFSESSGSDSRVILLLPPPRNLGLLSPRLDGVFTPVIICYNISVIEHRLNNCYQFYGIITCNIVYTVHVHALHTCMLYIWYYIESAYVEMGIGSEVVLCLYMKTSYG